MTKPRFTTQTVGRSTRVSNGYHFGQVHKDGREWHAEIRESWSGALVRFAGIWGTKRDAIEEVERLLSKPEHIKGDNR